MRVVEFRAWDIDKQEYIPYFEISCDGCVTTQEPECSPDYPDVILEQYTGLKDKNGKKIYEGDIVDYNDDGECIGVVEYDAPEFCLNADATNWARMFLKGAPHQRVIGNIHENPELVKEKE